MIRFLLSIILITLLTVYALIPFYKHIRSFVNKEKKRVSDAIKEEND